jgi:hypothetical protein
MELAEIYSRAADYIEKHGWRQHSFGGSNGQSACLMGALLVTTGDILGKDFRFACAVLKESAIGPFLTRWNDTPGRTKEEVIAFLREQAVKAGLSVPATHIIEIPEPQPLEIPVEVPEAEPVEEPDLVPA